MVIECAPESGGAEGSALASSRNKVLTSFGGCKYSLWKRTSISKYWTCMTFNLLVDKHLIISTSSCAHLKDGIGSRQAACSGNIFKSNISFVGDTVEQFQVGFKLNPLLLWSNRAKHRAVRFNGAQGSLLQQCINWLRNSHSYGRQQYPEVLISYIIVDLGNLEIFGITCITCSYQNTAV